MVLDVLKTQLCVVEFQVFPGERKKVWKEVVEVR
jgi:hypothetical protein